jgi:hypothetical protein
MSWKLGIRALVSVDRGMELLSTRPWFKSEVDTRNLREESNITANLASCFDCLVSCCACAFVYIFSCRACAFVYIVSCHECAFVYIISCCGLFRFVMYRYDTKNFFLFFTVSTYFVTFFLYIILLVSLDPQ